LKGIILKDVERDVITDETIKDRDDSNEFY
jgi:hypothetical protein